MSLCTEGGATPRSPRGQWTAKKVLDAMTDALVGFLDTYYFMGSPTHDEQVASAKAEEMYMDDDIDPEGGKRKGSKVVEDDFYAEVDSAQNMLYAYEHIIREGAMLDLPTHDMPSPPAAVEAAPVEARKHWQQMAPPSISATPAEPLPAPVASPAKAAKANKKAAKSKGTKAKAASTTPAAVPRAVALNKAAAPKPAKAKAAPRLAKKASARLAVSVRI
jgi:hypothetical protein